MLDSAERLARAGADFLICPANTFHAALPLIEARSPLPWLHIADAVADDALARGFRRLGLLGTRWLVESEVYPGRLAARGLGLMLPAPEDRAAVDCLILEELVLGVFRPQTAERTARAIAALAADGADAVILGCTELPLLIDEARSPLPTLDSTRLLARAALRRATEPR
jgi:aspartate racemase